MKSQFQDIIPPEKRSIRNITLSAKDIEERNEAAEEIEPTPSDVKPRRRRVVKHEDLEPEEIVFRGKTRSKGLPKLMLWLISAGCLVALFLVVTHFLNSATLTIGVKSWQENLPAHLPLSLEPAPGEVGYSTIDIKDSLSDTLPATGEKEVSSKATGTIIIYNNFNSTVQKLVAGTRFQSSKGLIYKLDKTINVPGSKTVSGKVTPGSIEATVTADVAGKDYNIGLDDFTIPGFKGSPKFDKFYARSKTSMTGGNTGKIATVSDSDLAAKVKSLESQLDSKLKDKSAKQLPANQVIIPGLTVSTYTVGDPQMQDGKASVTVTESMKVYLLDSNTLAAALLKSEDVSVAPTDEFVFDTTAATGTITASTNLATGITFAGKVTVSHKLDLDKFKADVAGVSNKEIPLIAAKYPAISEISTNIKPFWKSSLPNDVSKITVIEK